MADETKATPVEGMQESVTAKLFPELETPIEETKPKGNVEANDVATPVTKTDEATTATAPAPAIKAEEKKPESKTDPDYLPIEDIGKKKIKTKIDGVEGEITIEEALKGYQTAQHLSRKGQQIGEEARRLREEREALERAKALPKDEPTDEFYKEYIAPHVQKFENEISQLKQVNSALSSSIQPMLYQANIDKADKTLKAEGFDDFKEKIPEIKQYILANVPPEQWDIMDTVDGAISVYKYIKLDEFKKKSSMPKELTIPDKRPKPDVVPIVESSSSSSGANTDTKTQEIDNTFERAKQTGSKDDWVRHLMARESS